MSIFELRGGEAVREELELGDVGRLEDCWPFEQFRSFFSFNIDEIPTLLRLGGDKAWEGSMLWAGGGTLS